MTHTPEPWPKKPEAHAVKISMEDYNHARLCVNLFAAAKEYDKADDNAHWESPHPIFQMAADVDRLKQQNAALSEQVAGLETQLTRAESTEASWGRRCIRDAEAKELAEAKIAKAARDVEQIVTGRITGGSDADNLYQCRKIAAGIYCDLTGEELDEQAIAKAGSHE